MPESGTQLAHPDVDIIEGGTVEQVVDLPFEEPRHRAKTARILAYLLVAILGITILAQYALTTMLILMGKESSTAVLDKLFNSLLPVLSGLVGGAVTYYFTKEKS